MNLKKFIKPATAILACGAGMWVAAGLWHNLIMPALYKDTHATHEGIGIMLVAYIVLALIMVYLYPMVYRGGKPAAEGLKFGILIGILWVFPHDLAMVGAHGTSLTYVFKNALWHIIEQGIGGVILGLIYGRMKK